MITQKNLKNLIQVVNAYSAFCNANNLPDSFQIDLIIKLKHIILEIF